MTLQFDLQNISDHQGLAISLVGMSIVFTGLLLVSLFIYVLPRILDAYDGLRGINSSREAAPSEQAAPDEKKDAEIRAAIAVVMEMALAEDDGSANQRITIRRSPTESMWREIGQMRSLSSKPPF